MREDGTYDPSFIEMLAYYLTKMPTYTEGSQRRPTTNGHPPGWPGSGPARAPARIPKEAQNMDRPKVVTLAIASVDGRVAMSPGKLLLYGDERWSEVAGYESEVDKRLRAIHRPQAVLEGSGSFIADTESPEPLPHLADGDPAKTRVLYEDYLPEAVVSRPDHRGWFTIVDSRGRIRWVYKEWPGEEWQGWHLLVLVSKSTPAEYLAYLRRETIPYLVAGECRVDLRLALAKLAEKLHVSCVLSTGAARLNGALLREGLVDEVNVEVFPALIGGTNTPSLFDSPDMLDTEEPFRLELISAEVRPGGRVWLRYRRKSD